MIMSHLEKWRSCNSNNNIHAKKLQLQQQYLCQNYLFKLNSNFEHILHFFLVFFIVDFEQVNVN